MRGRFISLEGGEGAGKSTQARLLAEALKARGIEVVLTREPGGSQGAEDIRALLMQGEVGRWDQRAEALLFAAARADHVRRLIRPALEAGQWVICDRYLDSTRAYQGAQGVADADVLMLHGFGSQGLMPDRTLLLELPSGEGAARASARDGDAADRFGARDQAFHDRVAVLFARIAEQEPARVRRIDATGAAEAVSERLVAALQDLLP